MSTGHDLLVEIGTEELPPTALRGLMEAFAGGVLAGLAQAELTHGAHRPYATPRRLALLVEGLPETQPQRQVERRGPALAAAFDADGQPTRAALGFARSCGVAVDALQRLETDKGSWLAYRAVEPGAASAELLPAIVERALGQLPIPKRMRWGSREASFVRPVHWIVLLLGDAVVPARLFDLNSGRQTRGHRFHAPGRMEIRRPADYARRLGQDGFVVADFDERRSRVRAGVEATAEDIGGRAVIEDALLDEVTALVEWPVPLAGSFDREFLRVPEEALVSSMQGHQRYFPVRDADGALLPRFVTVANLESREPSQVVAGNERVIRPRLADAAFFWDADRRRPLADRIPALAQVVFQQRLGSLHDKSARVATLGASLCGAFGVAPDRVERAAWLARTDLLTEMVGEFPELQGIMGRYYAIHDGEPPDVAVALDEQYRPRFAGDAVAATPLGQLLAVAERADTLLGAFTIGKAPSGAKDPFALRRAALGLLRTLLESHRALDLRELFAAAGEGMPEALDAGAQVEPVVAFCLERLRYWYLEQGVPAELFEAVRSAEEAGVTVSDPVDFQHRLEACRSFAGLPEAASLAAANKRIRNILRKSAARLPGHVDPERLQEPAERDLYEAVSELAAEVEDRVAAGEYEPALHRLAQLRDPVDRFFDQVLVMAEDPVLQANRLALLDRLSRLFLSIADVSRLPGGEAG